MAKPIPHAFKAGGVHTSVVAVVKVNRTESWPRDLRVYIEQTKSGISRWKVRDHEIGVWVPETRPRL